MTTTDESIARLGNLVASWATGSHRQTHSGHECQDQSRWRSPAADTMRSNRLEGCSFFVRGIQHLGQRWKDQGFSVELDSRLNMGWRRARVTRITMSSSLPRPTRTHTAPWFIDETPVTGCTWRLTCGPPLPRTQCQLWQSSWVRLKSRRLVLSITDVFTQQVVEGNALISSLVKPNAGSKLMTRAFKLKAGYMELMGSIPKTVCPQVTSESTKQLGEPSSESASQRRRPPYLAAQTKRALIRNPQKSLMTTQCPTTPAQKHRQSFLAGGLSVWARIRYMKDGVKGTVEYAPSLHTDPTHWEDSVSWSVQWNSRHLKWKLIQQRRLWKCACFPCWSQLWSTSNRRQTACSAEYGEHKHPLQVDSRSHTCKCYRRWKSGIPSVPRLANGRLQSPSSQRQRSPWASCCGSRTQEEVRELQGVQVRNAPVPTMIDSKPQSIQPHLQSKPAQARHGVPWGSRVSASATANSDIGRGRDECLRVNFRKVIRKRDAHNVNKSDWKMWFKKSDAKIDCKTWCDTST